MWCRTNGPRSRKTRYMTSAATKPRRPPERTVAASATAVRGHARRALVGRGHRLRARGVCRLGVVELLPGATAARRPPAAAVGRWPAGAGSRRWPAGSPRAAPGTRQPRRAPRAQVPAGPARPGPGPPRASAGPRSAGRRTAWPRRHGLGRRGLWRHDVGRHWRRRVARRLVGTGGGVTHRCSSMGVVCLHQTPGATRSARLPGSGKGPGQGRLRAYPERMSVRWAILSPVELVDRVRAGLPPAEEKRMFGGTGFMVDGALACSVSSRGLLVRVLPEHQADLVATEGVAADGHGRSRRAGAGCTSTRGSSPTTSRCASGSSAGSPRRRASVSPGAVTKSMSSSTRPSSSGSRSA